MRIISNDMREEIMDDLKVLIETANFLADGDKESAKDLIKARMPHKHIKYSSRSMSEYEKLKIYFRDGFIDRYSGKQLLFPNVLRLLSHELGEVFPYQKNWKMSECHVSYWNYMPTYDHLIPIARGGLDVAENIVTTSMLMNSIKSNWTIEEVEFRLYEKGDLSKWDGMTKWYREYIEKRGTPEIDDTFMKWHKALMRIDNEAKESKE